MLDLKEAYDEKTYIARAEFNLKLRTLVHDRVEPGEEYQQILIGVINRTLEKLKGIDPPDRHYNIILTEASHILCQLLYDIYWYVETSWGKIICHETAVSSYAKIEDLYRHITEALITYWKDDYKFEFIGLIGKGGNPPKFL